MILLRINSGFEKANQELLVLQLQSRVQKWSVKCFGGGKEANSIDKVKSLINGICMGLTALGNQCKICVTGRKKKVSVKMMLVSSTANNSEEDIKLHVLSLKSVSVHVYQEEVQYVKCSIHICTTLWCLMPASIKLWILD